MVPAEPGTVPIADALNTLGEALTGRIQPHHLMLIGQILEHIDFLEQAIA